MNQLDVRILDFISAHQIITVCFQDDQLGLHCINCFYYFDEPSRSFVLKSSSGAMHDMMVIIGRMTAGTLLPQCLKPGLIQGIQWRGEILASESFGEIDQKLSQAYARRYPLSLAMPGYFWIVRLDWIKFTDSILGFRKKLLWSR